MHLMKMIRLVALVAAVLLCLVPTASAQPTTVVLVRHAEKAAAPGPDPELSEAGLARAAALAYALSDAGVSSIITTQFKRTRATAAQLAEKLGLTSITVGAGAELAAHAQATATAVRARPAGGVVLVVGHSNTIPVIIRALGGPEFAELCDSEYDKLFVLQIDSAGSARLFRTRYGAPDDPNAPPCVQSMRQP
jgi:broad specificity phosphatase PhoE